MSPPSRQTDSVSRGGPPVPATSRGKGSEPGIAGRTLDRHLVRHTGCDPYAGVLRTRRHVKQLDADSAPRTVVSYHPRQPSNPPPPKRGRRGPKARPTERLLGSKERSRCMDSRSRAPCRCDHRRAGLTVGQRTRRIRRIHALAEASATASRRGFRSNARSGPVDRGVTPKCPPRHILYPRDQTTERRPRLPPRCRQRDRARSAPHVAASLRSRPNRLESEDPRADRC